MVVRPQQVRGHHSLMACRAAFPKLSGWLTAHHRGLQVGQLDESVAQARLKP